MTYDSGKYKVVKTVPRDSEQLPTAFLADSLEEAERIYCEFSKLLNDISYSYHKNTGLDKADLFGEGLIGLAKANRDYDPNRGDFKTYAIYRIKDAINKYVREASLPVKIPSYIKKANALICELKSLTNDSQSVIVDDIPRNIITLPILERLERYARRGNISIEELFARAEYLPSSCEYEDEPLEDDTVYNGILIGELKEKMTESELIVVEGFLIGKNFSAISADNGKSESWAKNTFDRMCKRLSCWYGQ